LCKMKLKFAEKMKIDNISNNKADRKARKKVICNPRLGPDVTFR
jgi:hypothetical protein